MYFQHIACYHGVCHSCECQVCNSPLHQVPNIADFGLKLHSGKQMSEFGHILTAGRYTLAESRIQVTEVSSKMIQLLSLGVCPTSVLHRESNRLHAFTLREKEYLPPAQGHPQQVLPGPPKVGSGPAGSAAKKA